MNVSELRYSFSFYLDKRITFLIVLGHSTPVTHPNFSFRSHPRDSSTMRSSKLLSLTSTVGDLLVPRSFYLDPDVGIPSLNLVLCLNPGYRLTSFIIFSTFCITTATVHLDSFLTTEKVTHFTLRYLLQLLS